MTEMNDAGSLQLLLNLSPDQTCILVSSSIIPIAMEMIFLSYKLENIAHYRAVKLMSVDRILGLPKTQCEAVRRHVGPSVGVQGVKAGPWWV